jgi:hypothetical protein
MVRCCRSVKQAEYAAAIRKQDGEQLMALLTDESVEQRVVERVRLKAATFGQDLSAAGSDNWQGARGRCPPAAAVVPPPML